MGKSYSIKEEKIMKDLDMNKSIMNYRQVDQVKVHFKLNEGCDDDLIFGQADVSFQQMHILYETIDKMDLSMCSRIYTPAVVAKGPVDFLSQSLKSGAFATMPGHMIYSLDIDIQVGEEHYLFESYSFDNILDILELLDEHNVFINDPLDLKSILRKYQDREKRQQYFDKHYPQMAKTFSLDNPRGVVIAHGGK